MPFKRILFAASASFALSACATVSPQQPVAAPPPAPAPAETSAHDRLFKLFADADEGSLKNNPISALFRGDLRYADKIGDFLDDTYFDAERRNAQGNLDALYAIGRGSLNATDQIAYDVFEYNQKEALKNLTPEMMALTVVRPVNHFSGFHTFYPTFASGTGAAPFKSVTDYENNLKRHANYIDLIDKAIVRFREGMVSGVFETKLTTRNVIEQLDTQLKQPVEQSPYWGPIGMFPETFSAAEKARLTDSYRASTGEVYAANKRLRDFLQTEYLPLARDTIGLSQMKGGPGLYATMIEQTTTLPLTPDYLHDLGLAEVRRIHAEMEKVKTEVGFRGSLKQFFDHIRTSPQFKRKSREEMTARYYEIGKMVDAKVPEYFSLVPKTPLEIRPYEPFREKFEAGGSYQQGTPDGSRPGIFYFNAYDLPTRTTPGEVTLYLHEGAPGHHFQISLAQENEALPAFIRFGGNTAYVEGWALYAETLGYAMGFYKDPYTRQGTLDDEMLRAMRLVVDTGIHAKGWTRNQAITYMIENSSMGKTDATAEVERYIAIPSQALAYKVGALKIMELRKKAETALGSRFDIKDFHAQVLGTGALPLPVLEKKIDSWIASKPAG